MVWLGCLDVNLSLIIIQIKSWSKLCQVMSLLPFQSEHHLKLTLAGLAYLRDRNFWGEIVVKPLHVIHSPMEGCRT